MRTKPHRRPPRRTSAFSRSIVPTPNRSRFDGLRRSLRHQATNGRSLSSITHCIHQAIGTARILRLREVLEPLFLKYNVSVVLTGHDHFYKRVKPQKDITYFVVGSGGQLRRRNIDRQSGITAKGFDTHLAFLAAEISGDQMYFMLFRVSGKSSTRVS